MYCTKTKIKGVLIFMLNEIWKNNDMPSVIHWSNKQKKKKNLVNVSVTTNVTLKKKNEKKKWCKN